MNNPSSPFSEPSTVAPELARVVAHWQGLRRGQNSIPFWDDLDLGALSFAAERLLVLDVFEKPERYRFAVVGREISDRYGAEIPGRFADEIAPRDPLEYLRAQCSATIECGQPTYYRHIAAAKAGQHALPGYTRLLLPMWGEGHIAVLLGALAWG